MKIVNTAATVGNTLVTFDTAASAEDAKAWKRIQDRIGDVTQFIVRGMWHGEAFTAALRAIPTAYRESLAHQARKTGWEIVVERGRLDAISVTAHRARVKNLETSTFVKS